MIVVLKEKNFFRLWVGQVLSQSGARMVQIAVLWWGIGQAGDSAGRWAGGLLVLSALPSLVFVKLFGGLIDKWPSRRILFFTDLASGIFVGLLAVFFGMGFLSTPVIYALVFCLATFQSLLDPTLNKSVAQVVSPEGLGGAVALATSTQSLANFSGAMLGALLIDKIGVVATLSIAACGYGVAATATFFTYFKAIPAPTTAEAEATPWQVLGRYPFLKRVLFGFGLVNFFSTPTLLVLPLYVKRVLEMQASQLGLLEAALWMGLILGTWASGLLSGSFSVLRLAFICLLAMGFGFALPAFSPAVAVSFVCLAVVGMALGINNARFVLLFQKEVADHEKGRFFSILSAVLGFTFPVAYLLFGVLVDLIPVTTVMVVQGLGTVVMAFYFLWIQNTQTAGCGDKKQSDKLVFWG